MITHAAYSQIKKINKRCIKMLHSLYWVKLNDVIAGDNCLRNCFELLGKIGIVYEMPGFQIRSMPEMLRRRIS